MAKAKGAISGGSSSAKSRDELRHKWKKTRQGNSRNTKRPLKGR